LSGRERSSVVLLTERLNPEDHMPQPKCSR
jgi:hypothetical protein